MKCKPQDGFLLYGATIRSTLEKGTPQQPSKHDCIAGGGDTLMTEVPSNMKQA